MTMPIRGAEGLERSRTEGDTCRDSIGSILDIYGIYEGFVGLDLKTTERVFFKFEP